MYVPTNFIKNYIENHGKFSVDDEEMNKAIELFYVFTTLYASGEEDDLKPELISSPDVQEFRKSICEICPRKMVIKGINTCTTCGCNIDNKITKGKESCPVGKWSCDLKLLRSEMNRIVEFLNSKIGTDFYDKISVESMESYQKEQLENPNE